MSHLKMMMKTRTRLMLIVGALLLAAGAAVFALRAMSADTFSKFGGAEQSRAGKLIEMIAPRAFSNAEPAAKSAPAAGRMQRLVRAEQIPDGLQGADWEAIRSAHQKHRHAVVPGAGGQQARNPGQQWLTRFDGRGFAVTPNEDAWSWGLELESYGFAAEPRAISGQARVTTEGQRVAYRWDEALEEWYVNDQRGLEHGFTLGARPPGGAGGAGGAGAGCAAGPLEFRLAVRGGLRPQVQSDGQGVRFVDAQGCAVVNYGGLKVWDADGKTLAARFEPVAGENKLRLAVEESGARYPLTIDPIAQQAYLKAGNTGSGDRFGASVAVSGDTVVVGAWWEDSSTTGVNSSPNEFAPDSGAAYVFTRSGGVWTQQAYLKASNTGAGDFFGVSVAVSGDTVVVGAGQEDSSTTGVNSTPNEGATNAGAAYVFTRSGGVWAQQAYLKASNTGANDLFGISVAVSGDTVVVGAYAEDSSTTGVNSTPDEGVSDAGAAYVFTRSGGVWAQQAYLKASNSGADDRFGQSVAVSGDTVVVGAFLEDSSTTGVNSTPDEGAVGSGAAYVFTGVSNNTPPTITAQAGVTRQQGSAASNSTIATVNDAETAAGSLTVTITSANPSNGVTISNLVNTGGTVTADIVAACGASNASFSLQVSDGSLTATATLNITVTAAPAPVITTQPASQTVCAGSPATFSVMAANALSYQWRKGGVAIGGATGSSYTLPSASAADAANYDVVVSGICGTAVTSNAASLSVNAATAITTQPQNQTACLGGSATFSVAAAGSGLSYQWRKGGVNISGATASSFTIPSVAAGDAASYDVVVTGSCGAITSSAASLTINPSTTITAQPVNQTACAGGSATFTVAASGSGTLTYQWRKGGANISGATAASFTINPVAAGDAGSYDVVVSSSCGSATSSAATLTVNPATAITSQPANQTVCAGSPATFSVTATGTGLSYQWRKGGVAISGATASSFTIPSAAAGDAGSYDVVVTGSCGSVTSAAATLTVNAAAAITSQPANQTVCAGSLATFSVTATGAGLSYQWRKGGVAISGATSNSFSIPSAAAGDAGNYDVVVTGSCGAVTSSAATLTVNAGATITSQPTNQTVCAGSPATFSVTATGTGLSYQWRKGGVVISGATSSSFSIPSAAAGDAGNYDVVVTGSCGTVTSNTASLTVNAGATITSQPTNQTVCAGSPASFSVTATGAGLSYQWRKGGVAIGGATSSSYSIPSAAAGDAGSYDVVVTGSCGTVTSNAATLTVNPATTITSQPANQTSCLGSSASFSVAATGTNLSYQWRKGGVAIGGATSATYNLASVAAGDAGSYDVVVTGACGTVTSGAATLTINSSTNINTQPANQTACAGGSATFTVAASGSGTVTYQWRKGGVAIPGATSASFTINPVAAGDAGSYDVVVSSSCGTVTSSAASLTVNPTTAVTSPPANQTVCAGAPASFSVAATGTGLSYQWRKGGVAISGATSATYSIASAMAGDAGSYDVVVTGSCGSVTSSAATLTVNAGATITSQPANQTVCAGSPASFSVTATGAGLSYQWRKGGVAISGATSSSYSIPSAAAGDAGNYDVVVTGSCGAVTSSAATLTVNAGATITSQPTNQTVCAGSPATFSVTATGTGLSYQWRKGGVAISGATGSSFSIPSAAAADAGSYDVVVTGSCGTVTSSAATLTVNPATAITAQPTNQATCLGGSVTFNVTAAGAGLSYQWRKGGVAISGATASSFTIPSVAAGDAGSYDVVVTGSCGTVTSNAASLSINSSTTINTQPANQTVCLGTAASFSVSASGTGALSYQWRKNGAAISGATGSTYNIPATVAGDAAQYDVVVTSSCGTVTSNAATLAFNAATAISTQPANQTVCAGAPASFSVTASGAGPFSYQWRKNGSNISGATASAFNITSATAGDAGSYDVVVTGACGSVTSNAATLTVNAAAAITSQPANQTVCAGSPATFSVTATGAGLLYQWRKGGVAISGATASSFTIPSAAAGDAGSYDVVITSSCGTLTSQAATLTVNPATAISAQPTNQTACIGGSVTFSVTASGAGLTYQWRKGGVAISGATASTFNLASAAAGDAGSYDVVVTGSCGAVTSSAATLTVNAGAAITSQPSDQTVCAGSPASFSVTASGSGLTYQWRRNGSNISGATSATYNIASATSANAGSYDVVITSSCGSITSNAATLTVNPATAITTQPANQSASAGQSATFSVTASGASLKYQWRKNGAAIGGATGSSYTIASVAAADAGNYDVVVTGACGPAVTSNSAVLTVNQTSTGCVRGHGYWKNHASEWPVSTLVLGSQSYTKPELLALLKAPVKGDASIILAHQHIAAKLNLASGASATAIATTIQAADNWLSQFSGKLPYGVAASSQQGQVAVNLAGALDSYNNGTLAGGPPPCDSSAVGPTTASTRAVRNDFDGDGKSDPNDWNPETGEWRIRRSSDDELQIEQWGAAGDLPVAADYDGDGQTDLAVWRAADGQWLVKRSSDGEVMTRQWGQGADTPVAADYDGDGQADLAVWRGSEGVWQILRGSDDQVETASWGLASAPYFDLPVAADYDGDGRTDIAVWRRATGQWFIRRSSDGTTQVVVWGAGLAPYGDLPVPADYDGDGKDDVAVFRRSNGHWYIKLSSDGSTVNKSWGLGADAPLPADYDGDGKADVAVWRAAEGKWYALGSASNSVISGTGDAPRR